MIEVDDVSKTFWPQLSLGRWLRALAGSPGRGVNALSDVSFFVPKGGSLGILGCNGSGKSTLLKIVAGLTRPTRGRVSVKGRVTGLFELGSGFDPHLDGRQNIELAGAFLGIPRRELRQRMPAIVEFSGLGGHIDRPVREYSAGMFLRLAFSLATHVDAEALLVDEVLAVGDVAFRRQCTDRLRQFREAGGTLVLVSHDLIALSEWCTRFLWLEQGRVRRIGQTTRLLDAYALEAARFTVPAALETRSCSVVQLTGVKVLDSSGASNRSFMPSSPCRIQLHYDLARPIDAPVFGIVLSRDDWTPCLSVDTINARPPIGRRGPGQGFAELILDPIQLLPGRYLVSGWIRTGDKDMVSASPAIESIDVRGGNGEHGIFRPNYRWETTGC